MPASQPYDEWNAVVDPDGAIISMSPILLVVNNTDGTYTRVSGTGFTYGIDGLSGGTITGVDRLDPATNTVIQSLNGIDTSVVDLIATLDEVEAANNIYDDIRTATIFNINDETNEGVFTPTLISFTDTDGYAFEVIGVGFDPIGNSVDLQSGIVQELRIVSPDGVVLYSSGSISLSLFAVSIAFSGDTVSIVSIAADLATDIYVDASYDGDTEFYDVASASVGRNFDLNGSSFFGVGYYASGPIVADLAAGTVLRDGVTDTFSGTPTGFGLLDGSEFDDTIRMGGTVFRGVYGAGGNDTIIGSANNDQIEGGDGSDYIEGGAGADEMWGNGFFFDFFFGFNDPNEINTLAYTTSDEGVVIDMITNIGFGGHAEGDEFYGFANVIGSEHSDTIIGDDEDNTLWGGDVLMANDGKDTIYGGDGNDVIYGGADGDFLYGENGDDRLYGGFGIDSLFGGEGNDQLWGDENTDRLEGGLGNDELFGGQGFDNLYGDDGEDVLYGGIEADRLYGGDGMDTLYGGSNFTITVDGLFGGAGNDTLYGEAGFDYLDGGDGDDYLDGGHQADNLFGRDGNDILIGDLGLDRLFGGNGNDIAYGGDGNDGLFGEFGDDTLYGGDGDDRFFGAAGDDIIYGGTGNDTINGGSGFDTIYGGTGDDIMFGRFNADTFVFEDGHGNDTIGDFAAGNVFEKIDLSAVSVINNLADLNLGNATAGAATQVGGNVLIDTGGGNSITLIGVDLSDLDSSDFIF